MLLRSVFMLVVANNGRLLLIMSLDVCFRDNVQLIPK